MTRRGGRAGGSRAARVEGAAGRLGLALAIAAGALGPAPAGAGTVFAFGSNSVGRACLGDEPVAFPAPTPIDAASLAGASIVVASGADGDFLGSGDHSLLLAADGRVFSCGVNTNGRTGLGHAVGSTTVATEIAGEALGGARIVQVAAGGAHSLLLTEAGAVYVFGYGSNGQTCRDDTGSVSSPTPIASGELGGLAVEQIAAGSHSSLLLAEDGRVYACGANLRGQTGLGTASGITRLATAIATANLGERAIVQISAGVNHALLLADDGTVFAMGSNDDGRTGLGTDSGDTTVATAIDASNLGGARIAQVAAGGSHSLVLTEDGTVFAFGRNADGATGLGTETGDTLVATAIDATPLAGARVVEIAAGGNQSLLRTEDGRAFGFGSNLAGAAGLGDGVAGASVATPLDATHFGDAAVVALAAGRSHGFVIVPEPAGATLVAAGALAALARRRRAALAPLATSSRASGAGEGAAVA